MKRIGVNYDRVESAWEPRFLVGDIRCIFAGYWTHGVPNQQPVTLLVSPDDRDWGYVVPPKSVTEA